jgi:hypothetical protein
MMSDPNDDEYDMTLEEAERCIAQEEERVRKALARREKRQQARADRRAAIAKGYGPEYEAAIAYRKKKVAYTQKSRAKRKAKLAIARAVIAKMKKPGDSKPVET